MSIHKYKIHKTFYLMDTRFLYQNAVFKRPKDIVCIIQNLEAE